MKIKCIVVIALMLIILLAIGVIELELPQMFHPSPPGWTYPVSILLLDVTDLPEGWQIDFSSPQYRFSDPTISHVGREFWNPSKGSAGIILSIWRSYTDFRSVWKFVDLRQSTLLTNKLTPSPYDDIYIEFQPPNKFTYKGTTADQFYIACGWNPFSFCEIIARYRNYSIYLEVPLEAEYHGYRNEGLSFQEIEKLINAMDKKFATFFERIKK